MSNLVLQWISVPDGGHNMTETNQKCCTWQQTFTIYCQFIITIQLHSDQVRLRILLATNQMNIPNQSVLTTQCWWLTHTVPEKQPLPVGQWCRTCGSKLYCPGTDILTSEQVLILQSAFSLLVNVIACYCDGHSLNCFELFWDSNKRHWPLCISKTESEVGQYVKVRQLNLRRATDTNKRRGSLD
jgi:hypothetical protein